MKKILLLCALFSFSAFANFPDGSYACMFEKYAVVVSKKSDTTADFYLLRDPGTSVDQATNAVIATTSSNSYTLTSENGFTLELVNFNQSTLKNAKAIYTGDKTITLIDCTKLL